MIRTLRGLPIRAETPDSRAQFCMTESIPAVVQKSRTLRRSLDARWMQGRAQTAPHHNARACREVPLNGSYKPEIMTDLGASVQYAQTFLTTRVLKPDETVVITPPDFVQDMPTEVSRTAPFYSDLREKQVAVKRLSSGDVLEYAAAWQQDNPLAPGNFWFSWQFPKNFLVLDNRLEISIPAEREVKIKSH
jgi:Domain of Unknown Function with PDB structure (DUF3857)